MYFFFLSNFSWDIVDFQYYTYLTNSLPIVDRFSLSFKSEVDGKIYRHIVLAVKIRGFYGAIGLSRKDDLHWKEPVYKVFTINL